MSYYWAQLLISISKATLAIGDFLVHRLWNVRDAFHALAKFTWRLTDWITDRQIARVQAVIDKREEATDGR